MAAAGAFRLPPPTKIHSLTAEKRTNHDSEQMDLEMYLAEIEGGERMAEAAE